MHEKRIDDEFVYYGFGFPVTLLNVPMIKVRGDWTPHINYNNIEKEVFLTLAKKHFCEDIQLADSQIKFIKHYLLYKGK